MECNRGWGSVCGACGESPEIGGGSWGSGVSAVALLFFDTTLDSSGGGYWGKGVGEDCFGVEKSLGSKS